MARSAVHLLVALTLVGVATGGLLRPCDCLPHGLAAGADAQNPGGSCCHPSPRPARDGAPDDGTTRLCRKGPPPGDEPGPSPVLPKATLASVPASCIPPAALVAEAPRTREVATTTGPPWRRAPAGLSRFVI